MIERPRLLDHVLTRRYRSSTSGPPFVVLYDVNRLEHSAMAVRSYIVLSAMDGTRDLAGIVAYAAREEVPVDLEELRAFVLDLEAKGLIADGIAQILSPTTKSDLPPSNVESSSCQEGQAASDPASSPDARPIVHQPGFLLACDGGGTCCRFYPSIAFTPLDVARARAAQPLVENAGFDERRGFMPVNGLRSAMRSVTIVDGRCAYLEANNRCGIHRTAGEASKPLGCRTYPARFIDDGERLRVGPLPECACVFKSGVTKDPPGGSILLPPEIVRRGQIDQALQVDTLPLDISVTRTRTVSRAKVVAWSDALLDVRITDGVAALLGLSRVLNEQGLDIEACKDALTSANAATQANEHLFRRGLDALTPHLARVASEQWRSPTDIVRTTITALVGASDLARSALPDLLEGPGKLADVEQFYVRTLLFGHDLVPKQSAQLMAEPRRSIASNAIDRAMRMLLARSLTIVVSLAELSDPAFAWPLALVEASMRGYGLAAYARDFAALNQGRFAAATGDSVPR